MRHQLSLSPKPAVLRVIAPGSVAKSTPTMLEREYRKCDRKEAEGTESNAEADDGRVDDNVIERNVREYPSDSYISVGENVPVEIEGLS